MLKTLGGISTLALFPLACLAQSQADREAILRTFDTWDRGWEERNVELAIADYAEEVDWTNAFGDRFEGKAALREGLTFIFSLGFVMAGESASNEYTDVRFLAEDVAIVRSKLVRTGQKTSEGDFMPDRHMHHLRVYEKQGDRWLIVSHLIAQAQQRR